VAPPDDSPRASAHLPVTATVAVRAALPSPRPQGWQAAQMARGLAECGVRVRLVGDAARPDAGPSTVADWTGPLPETLALAIPARPARPPWAGLRFRAALGRSTSDLLVARDARVLGYHAARRYPLRIFEWHERPDRARADHRAALASADLHVAVSPGLVADLAALAIRARWLPNACSLDRTAAARRAAHPAAGGPVLILGLHRRGGVDAALAAWEDHADLPDLWLGGRDADGLRATAWAARIAASPSLRRRVRLIGPAFGATREALFDAASLILAPYPRDADSVAHLCPLQVREAAGSGRRLVAPDLPSIHAACPSQLLTPYAADDPDSLAAAVREALTAPADADAALAVPRWADRAAALLAALPGRLAA
jgi:hypothetical protein